MTQPAIERNPFALLIDPQAVLAAVEKSERLGRLNRHLCRPLDRVGPATAGQTAEAADVQGDDSIPDSQFAPQ